METNRRGLFNKKWIIAFLVYIGLVALCCVALYAVPSVMGILERTYIAEHGTIDVADEVSAFIVRDEKVYVAAQKSKINRLADSDRLVKAGTKVVELTPTDEELAEETEAEAKTDEKAADSKEAKTDEKTADSKDAKTDEKKDADGDSKDKEKADAEAAEEEELDKSRVNLGRYTSIINELGD